MPRWDLCRSRRAASVEASPHVTGVTETMNKTLVLVIAAFLGGALVGALAVAAYAPSPQTPVEVQGPTPDAAMAVREATPSGAGVEVPSVPAAAVAEAGGEAPPADAGLAARVQELGRGWTRLEGEVARLQARIDGLERRLTAVQPAVSDPVATPPADPTEARRTALVKVGVTEDVAAQLVWREAQTELERLELRDLALREGWFGSDRYREELNRIQTEAPKLRTELGDELYDRYLYAMGEQNRIRVSSVIPGSAAEDAGLRPGDMIETYEGAHIFGFGELRSATSAGERGELVAVQVRRADGSRMQAWVPRGPLGVRLEMGQADPDA